MGAFFMPEGRMDSISKSKTYEEFVKKFKPKKTTDDCMTPPEVYEAVRDWACEEYGIDPAKIVRPFWPGGDYESFDYSNGRVVLDNPPFSILSKICGFYLERGVPFFLFAPTLTLFSSRETASGRSHLICDCDIVYENGAKIATSFVTSYDADITAQTAPELAGRIARAQKKIKAEKAKTLPRYEYPDAVLTAAMMQKYCRYGIGLAVRREECAFVAKLDAQREKGKGIFGGGLLLSERAAAERAAAERAAAERAAAERAAAERAAACRWELSEREKEICSRLG